MSDLFSTKRCESCYYRPTNKGIWIGIRCSNALGHPSINHMAFAGDDTRGKWLSWNDEEATDSFERYRTQKVTKRVGALTGWRCWRLGPAHLLLSTSRQHIWEGPVATTFENRMVTETNHVPEVDRDYGVYSYKSPVKLLKYFPGIYSGSSYPSYPVVGRVDVLGHVIEHELGWRAQKVIIRELWFVVKNNLRDYIIDDLEASYQCPVNALKSSQVNAWAEWFDSQQEEAENV
jgi:hypothetical protein